MTHLRSHCHTKLGVFGTGCRPVADYVIKHGAKFIMRPEFLMYFVSMSPKMADVDHIYQRVFPSIHGVRLGSRVRESVMHDVMGRAKKYVGLDPARITAELESFSNRLKGDQLKRYEARSSD